MSLRDGSEEDEQVRPLGPEPHQPDRRRGHHRAQDPPRQDRPGAAAGRPRAAGWPAGGAQPGRHLRRPVRTPTMPACCATMAASGFGPFKEALAAVVVASAGPDRRRDPALAGRPRRDRPPPGRGRRSVPPPSPTRSWRKRSAWSASCQRSGPGGDVAGGGVPHRQFRRRDRAGSCWPPAAVFGWRRRAGAVLRPVWCRCCWRWRMSCCSSRQLARGGVQGDFSSLAGVGALFRQPAALLAGWLHYLAFDLLVGVAIVRAFPGRPQCRACCCCRCCR